MCASIVLDETIVKLKSVCAREGNREKELREIGPESERSSVANIIYIAFTIIVRYYYDCYCNAMSDKLPSPVWPR